MPSEARAVRTPRRIGVHGRAVKVASSARPRPGGAHGGAAGSSFAAHKLWYNLSLSPQSLFLFPFAGVPAVREPDWRRISPAAEVFSSAAHRRSTNAAAELAPLPGGVDTSRGRTVVEAMAVRHRRRRRCGSASPPPRTCQQCRCTIGAWNWDDAGHISMACARG